VFRVPSAEIWGNSGFFQVVNFQVLLDSAILYFFI
jgi:hypothetical protein